MITLITVITMLLLIALITPIMTRADIRSSEKSLSLLDAFQSRSSKLLKKRLKDVEINLTIMNSS